MDRYFLYSKNKDFGRVSIKEINRAIEHIAEGIQSNTAVAEESAASSEELMAQTESLNSMLSNFKLKQ